jgi:hypothetical protein
MTESNTIAEQANSRVGLQVGIGIAVSVIAVVILLLVVDVRASMDAIRGADYRWLPVAMVVYVVGWVARGYAWRLLLNKEISLQRSFWTLTEGYMFNNFLPLRMGEFGRGLLLNITEGLSFWRVMSTIVVERVFDVGFMAGILLSTAPFAIGLEGSAQIALVAAGLVVIGFVGLFLAARRPDVIMRVFERFTSPVPQVTAFGREKLNAMLQGLTSLSSIDRFLWVLLWMGLAWAFNVLFYYTLLLAFVPDAGVLMTGFLVGAAAMGVALPSSPGYVGVFHGTVVAALEIFGVPASVGLAYAIVAHLTYVSISAVLGAFALGRDGLSLLEVFRKLLERRSQPAEA